MTTRQPKEFPEWCVVGALFINTISPNIPPVKITRLLRNGNVMIEIEGEDKQFNVSHYNKDLVRVRSERNSYRSRTAFRLLTPEYEAELKAEANFKEARKIVSDEANRLVTLYRNGSHESVITEAAKIKSAASDITGDVTIRGDA